jgi:hypothetical protein
MTWSSVLSVVLLLIPTLVAVYATYRDKPSEPSANGLLKRHPKPFLYSAAALAFILGVSQIIWTNRDNKKNESDRAAEHRSDELQIAGLEKAVTTLKDTNQTQYERNQIELGKLRDQLNKIDKNQLTVNDKKEIALLQRELNESMAPKPKAKLDFTFWDSDLKKGEIRANRYIPADGKLVKFTFGGVNTSEINATGVSVWIRICDDCKFHSEPVQSIKIPNTLECDRMYKIAEVQPGVAFNEPEVEIDLPEKFTRMAISFQYRCADCVLEKDWQTLWADISRSSNPLHMSLPATTSKKPRKP